MSAPARIEPDPCHLVIDEAETATRGDIWQRASYDDWTARLGIGRMDEVLRVLCDQLQELLRRTFETDRPVLHRLAHDAASTAGMLGFLDVTCCCRALLEAPNEDDETTARRRLRDAVEAAIHSLAHHFARTDAAVEAA